MPCKVYAHVDVDGLRPFALPVEVPRPEETQFGTVKQALLQQFVKSFPEEAVPHYDSCCFWNQDRCPIPDRTPIAVYVWEHNDFFLRPLPEGAGGVEGSALAASRQQRGELSYYYAHDRGLKGARSLVSKPQVVAAAVSSVVPAAAARQPLKVDAAGPQRIYNSKQSPFGTDITTYETITTYTWEDHDGDTVKVLVPLDGIGKLAPEQVTARFSVRAFELLIDGYNGRRLRFACYKTHGEMKPEECRHVVRANRVNLVLRKAKEKDIWFDLFKKRAIGDDDEP